MAADTIVSGVIRGLLPYAVIGGVGYLAYRYIKNSDVGKTLKELPDKAGSAFKEAGEAANDWIHGKSDAPLLLQPNPVIRGAVSIYEGIRDWNGVKIPWE